MNATAARPTLVLMGSRLLSGLHGEETLAALLVLASFEMPLQLCLTGDAVQLLEASGTASFTRLQKMLASLAYYDLLPLWSTAAVNHAPVAVQMVDLQALDLNDFAQVLRW